jgi:hypothetical protein|tara:strand:+ start:463 stop:960 length:498 start_codon:yes stop_codon:yes gene_type:complete
MWTVLKLDKKRLSFLKEDFKNKLDMDFVFYSPKLLIEKFKKNKISKCEFDLLGDYVFCYHKKFEQPSTINILKFSRGLKYFLDGFISSQNEIQEFVNNCKKFENKNGYITHNIFKILADKKYKFSSGPFTSQIFKIIEIQKDKLSISIGNIKTKINKKSFLFYPI